jgi:hypothetical protein
MEAQSCLALDLHLFHGRIDELSCYGDAAPLNRSPDLPGVLAVASRGGALGGILRLGGQDVKRIGEFFDLGVNNYGQSPSISAHPVCSPSK